MTNRYEWVTPISSAISSFLLESLRKTARKRFLRMMRGYKRLQRSGRLGLIARLKNDLARSPLINSCAFKPTYFFYGASFEKSELITRQYLFGRIGLLGINKALLCSLGGGGAVIYPMPKGWQEIVERYGFKVARSRSSILWGGYVFLMWGYGITYIIRQIICSLWSWMKKKQSTLSQSAYFSGLSSGNLPRSRNLEPSYDIISWYVQWKDRDPAVKACAHSVTDSPSNSIKDVEVVYSPQPIPYLTDFFKIARFVLWGVNAILFSGFMALCGRWGGAFLLKEAAMAVTVRLLPSATLAHDYLFHNSAWIYRPLWTYEAKRKGSRIIFYFYSTNCETFKRSSGYPFQENFWHLVDWPLFLAWDEHQAEFLRREVQSPADIRVVGPVWFSDHSVPVPNLPRNTVAIFDVQPFREAWYRCYCLPVEYYTPAICTRFLEDVSCELNRMKYFPVLKKKRDIGNLAHPKYRYAVSLLKEQRALTLVDANVSAIQLIKRCVAVISMPFTSTALLGRDLGIPSVYYDPFGDVQKDDRAAHGIPVLLAKEELRDWLATLKDPARK